jgi:hypothetical protein
MTLSFDDVINQNDRDTDRLTVLRARSFPAGVV